MNATTIPTTIFLISVPVSLIVMIASFLFYRRLGVAAVRMVNPFSVYIITVDQGVEMVCFSLLIEYLLQLSQLFRVFGGQIDPFVKILIQVVQLPHILVE